MRFNVLRYRADVLGTKEHIVWLIQWRLRSSETLWSIRGQVHTRDPQLQRRCWENFSEMGWTAGGLFRAQILSWTELNIRGRTGLWPHTILHSWPLMSSDAIHHLLGRRHKYDVQLQYFFTSTETIKTLRSGESRTATSTFMELLSSGLTRHTFIA